MLTRPFKSLFLDRHLLDGAQIRWLAMHWLLASATLALVGVTWRLWTPQDVFPAVPLVSLGLSIPPWVDWLAAGSFLTAPWIAAMCTRRNGVRQTALAAMVAAGVLLIVANAHRLQPWAYQFMLIAAVLAMASRGRALGLCRMLTISIYFHSAWTKIDYSFVSDLGPRMVAPLGLPDSWARVAVVALPAAEMLVALGLLVGRTRTPALVASIAMHVALLGLIGPWGLDHSWGVLVWNVFFIVQNVLLFWPCERRARSTKRRATCRSRSKSDAIAMWLVVAAIALPFAEPWGLWDLWPSWGLYASKAERTVVLIRSAEPASLPAKVRMHLTDVPDSPDWQQLDLASWSLSALGVPLYPQNRFQLGVASRVADVLEHTAQVRVVLVSRSQLRTGERQADDVLGRPKIEARGAKYVLSAQPATNWAPVVE